MANQKHLKKLNQGVEAWYKWRNKNPSIIPDLSGADLHNAYLSRADLIYANLIGADLNGADLSYADLYGANLSDALLLTATTNRSHPHAATEARQSEQGGWFGNVSGGVETDGGNRTSDRVKVQPCIGGRANGKT